jgi:hypothetical protein
MLFLDAGVRGTRSPELSAADAGELAWFLISLHHHSQSLPVRARYRSDDLVQWQADRLFGRFLRTVREDADCVFVTLLRSKPAVLRAMHEARDALLAEGSSLVHGDFLPWNWAGKSGSLKVVDAECSFFGCPEMDAGAFLAGLLLSRQSDAALNEALYVLTDGCVRYDVRLMAAFASAHMCALLTEDSPDKGLACGKDALALLKRTIRAIEEGTVRPLFVDKRKPD